MELKNKLSFEVTKNDRHYEFNIPAGAPYGETYDAIFTFLEKIIDHQRANIDQQRANIESLKKQNQDQAQVPQ